MGMYKTIALTKEQYVEIIDLIKKGGYLDTRPNEQVAFALVLEGNLCMRIGDILNLSLKDIVKDGRKIPFTSC
jgi:integrase